VPGLAEPAAGTGGEKLEKVTRVTSVNIALCPTHEF
jgi:hypothetical protein